MPGIADALTSLTAALHARHIRTSMARRWQLIAYPHPVPNVQDTAWLTGNAGIWYVGTWAGLVFRADAESDFTSFLDDYAQDPKQVLEELETRQGFHALNDEEVAQFDRMLVVQSESLPVEIQPCDLLLDLAAASIKVVTLGHGVWRLSKPSSDKDRIVDLVLCRNHYYVVAFGAIYNIDDITVRDVCYFLLSRPLETFDAEYLSNSGMIEAEIERAAEIRQLLSDAGVPHS